MRRKKMMWLGSIALMGLLAPTIVRANIVRAHIVRAHIVRADVDPEAELTQMRTRLNAALLEAREQRTSAVAAMREYRERAKADVKDVDPATVAPAKGYAWAELFDVAQEPSKTIIAAQRFLTSHPEPQAKLDAQLLIVSGCVQTKDAVGVLATIQDVKPTTPAQAVQLASAATAAAEVVGTKKSVPAALAMLKEVEAQVPFDQLKTPKELESADRIFFALGNARAELYKQEGKQEEQLAALQEALKHQSPTSLFTSTLSSKINYLKVVGATAPPLQRERGYGEFAGLDAYKGKVVVIDFMAHWCGPCKAALPAMKQMYDELHNKGLEVVSVTTYYGSFDKEKGLTHDEEFARMEGFKAKYNMTWPLVFGDKTNMQNYGVSAIPQFVIIDQTGKVNSITLGYSPTLHDEMRKTIENLLNKKVALK